MKGAGAHQAPTPFFVSPRPVTAGTTGRHTAARPHDRMAGCRTEDFGDVAAGGRPLCAICQIVKADTRLRPPFRLRKGAAEEANGHSMGGLARCIPWNLKNTPWILPSKGHFGDMFGPDLCHIAAKKAPKRSSRMNCFARCASLSEGSDFSSFTCDGTCARKRRILRVKNGRRAAVYPP